MSSSSTPPVHVRAAGLTKRFRVAERRPGTLVALAGVVRRRHRLVTAVEDVSFTVRRVGPRRVSAAELIRRVTDRSVIRDLFVEDPPIERIIAELYHRHG